jgi:hypothetical protein
MQWLMKATEHRNRRQRQHRAGQQDVSQERVEEGAFAPLELAQDSEMETAF